MYRNLMYFFFYKGKFREEWYAAIYFGIRYKKYIQFNNLDLYLDIIRLSNWWDIVDSTATNLIVPGLQDHDQLENYLTEWIHDKNLWIRRTALLNQLKYRNHTNLQLLSELICTVMDEKEFFIQKAIGWVLRQYSYTNPDAVFTLIHSSEYRFSNLAKREAIKGLNRMGFNL